MIDSPGTEEVAEGNLIDMLEELRSLVDETEGLQMFIVLRGDPQMFSVCRPSV